MVFNTKVLNKTSRVSEALWGFEVRVLVNLPRHHVSFTAMRMAWSPRG
jgi:hypothetical protein